MDDSRDGVRGDEEEEEAVEGEPGQEVAAPPAVQPAQREEVHHRRQRREHRHSQACDDRWGSNKGGNVKIIILDYILENISQ